MPFPTTYGAVGPFATYGDVPGNTYGDAPLDLGVGDGQVHGRAITLASSARRAITVSSGRRRPLTLTDHGRLTVKDLLG